MDAFQMDSQLWAEKQFGQARLGNKTRTKRLVHLASQIAANPSGSLPEQTGHWKDLKAAYRLFDRKEVTFEAVATPHWEQTRQQCVSGRYLVIDDTSELDFGIRREIDGMGPTGNGGGYGFLLHSALAVAADSEAVVGLMGQRVHYRQHAAQKGEREPTPEAQARIGDLGPSHRPSGPATGRGAVGACLRPGRGQLRSILSRPVQGTSWVIRVTQLQRKIWDPSGKEMPLQQYLATLPAKEMQELPLRTRPAQPGRTAQLTISFGALTMPVPRQKSSYLQALKPGPIAMWVVWARELNAPKHGEAIEWVLYSALPVKSLDDAGMVLAYYEKRWGIEDWHKALKTGCEVTQRQLKTSQRLEPLVALLSVEAVRLLQLRSAARTEPERPAAEVVPHAYLAMLQKARGLKAAEPLTVRNFWRGLAKLGGFLGAERRGAGLDHHLARLGETHANVAWCGPFQASRSDRINMGKDKA